MRDPLQTWSGQAAGPSACAPWADEVIRGGVDAGLHVFTKAAALKAQAGYSSRLEASQAAVSCWIETGEYDAFSKYECEQKRERSHESQEVITLPKELELTVEDTKYE